jgi:hypothetical protein
MFIEVAAEHGASEALVDGPVRIEAPRVLADAIK